MDAPASQVSAPPSVPLTPAAFEPASATSLYWLGNVGLLINARATLFMIDPYSTLIEPGRIEG